jgi:hypothetical protein
LKKYFYFTKLNLFNTGFPFILLPYLQQENGHSKTVRSFNLVFKSAFFIEKAAPPGIVQERQPVHINASHPD